MKNAICIAINKALALTLIGAIITTGGFAVHLTHVQASLTVTFGDPVRTQIAMADVIDTSQLQPLPVHKPLVGAK